MKAITGLALLVAAVAVFFAVRAAPSVAPPKPDTVYQRITAKSETVSVATTRTLLRYQTRIDTMPGDTVYMTRVQWDTIRVACQACADQLAMHKRVSDSIIKGVRDSLVQCQAKQAAAASQRKWYALAGAAVTLVACR